MIRRILSLLQPFSAPRVEGVGAAELPRVGFNARWEAADRAQRAEPLQPRRRARHQAEKSAALHDQLRAEVGR